MEKLTKYDNQRGSREVFVLKNLGVVISVFFLIFGGIMFVNSLSLDSYGEYGPGPGLLPLGTSGVIIILASIYLVIALKKDIILFSEILPKGEGLINLLSCMGSIILFIIIISPPCAGFNCDIVIL